MYPSVADTKAMEAGAARAQELRKTLTADECFGLAGELLTQLMIEHLQTPDHHPCHAHGLVDDILIYLSEHAQAQGHMVEARAVIDSL